MIEGVTLHHVILNEVKMEGYGDTKEAIYNTFLGIEQNESSEEVMWKDEFLDYIYYNRLSAEEIQKMARISSISNFKCNYKSCGR